MSAPIDDGGPFFPATREVVGSGGYVRREQMEGISLRDWFAGQALVGCLAYSHVNPMSGNWQENCQLQDLAKAMYAHADAMLAARKEQPK